MYYHNSPTVKQLKQLKAQRATEMKQLLATMKSVTSKYDTTITKLEKLRKQELFLENEISTGRLSQAQFQHATNVVNSNRIKASRLVSKLLS